MAMMKSQFSFKNQVLLSVAWTIYTQVVLGI
jgi:hypothetical protein